MAFRHLAFVAALIVLSAPAAAHTVPASSTAFFNWSGLYFGVSGGYGWGDNTYSYDQPPRMVTLTKVMLLPSVGVDMDGGVIGGGVGYNWQSGAWVFGVEGDISAANIKGKALKNDVFTPPCTEQGCMAQVKLVRDRPAAARLRLGIWLPYVTGGLAFGGVQGGWAPTSAPAACCPGLDETRVGYALGGGT